MCQALWSRCVDKVDEETVAPRYTGGPRLDSSEVCTAKTQFGENKSERPRRMGSGDHDRGLVVLLIYNRIANRKDHESSGVVVLVQDVVEENLETVSSTGPWRSKRRNRRIACLGNLSDGPGCVVSWNGIDSQIKKRVLGLCKCLRVGTDLANILDRGAGYAVERVTYLNEVLGKDGEPHVACITWQPVEHRQDRSRRGIFDRNHETVDFTLFERIKGCSEPTMPDELSNGE